MEYNAHDIWWGNGMPALPKHFIEGDQDIFHALPHFSPVTAKYIRRLHHSFCTLLPVAACHIELVHNRLADPSAHSSISLSIPPVLVQAKCSSWHDMMFQTHHLHLLLWLSHTAPQSPHSHGPPSSLAPPIICISASNEKPSLIRWPSEIIYTPPPPSPAVFSTLFYHTSSFSPYPDTCQLSTPSRMLFGAGTRALIAPLSISIGLEWMNERDGSPDSLLSELRALDCRQALAFSLT